MHIKSKMLLPADPSAVEEEAEDPRDELVRRLLEYKKFKEIADQLKDRETTRQDLFTRVFDQEKRKEIKDDAKEVYFEANLFDLINAFTKALRKFSEKTVYSVKKEEYTVEQKIHYILHLLLEKSTIFISDLFGQCQSKMEVIVTFMGILELIRLKELVAIQRDVFGDIEVQRNKDNVIPVEADAPTTGPEAAAAFSSSGDEIALPEAPSEETSADEESLPKEASSEERNSSEPFSQN